MENTDSKNIILSVLGVAILLIAVVGISYAIFIFVSSGNTKNVINTGSITMNYTEDTNGISITNAMPTSDAIGKNQTEYFDFSLRPNINGKATINYEIRARKVSPGNVAELDGSLVKIYLEKINNNLREVILPPTSFKADKDTLFDNIKGDTMLLHRGTFINNNSNASFNEHYRLRMWLSDTAPIETEAKTFKIKVDVYSALQK